MWSTRNVFRSAPLLVPAMSLMAGIAVGDSFGTVALWWLLTGAALLLLAVFYRWPSWASLVLLLGMAALGGLRASVSRQSHNQVRWPEGFTRYEGVIVSEVSERPKTMGMDVVIAGSGRKVKCPCMT